MAYSKRNLCIALASVCLFACGGDDEPAGGGGTGGEAGAAAQSGSGGKAGASGASGASGSSGRSGAGGSAGGGAGMMAAMCSEPPPTGPVVCGGETCPTPMYMMNNCIVPCCATKGGKQVCGAKSTNPMLSTMCEPPAVADPSCPDADAMGTPLKGCCNEAQGKCGIISSVRPGCITQSMLIMLPDPPKACSGSSDDAGVADAGL